MASVNLRILLFIFFASTRTSLCDVTVDVNEHLVSVGSRVTIVCSSMSMMMSHNKTIVWTRRSRESDAAMEQVVGNGSLHRDMDEDEVTVITSSIRFQEVSTLIIKNITMESARYSYYCGDEASPNFRPVKVVLGVFSRDPVCVMDAMPVVENTRVLYTCTVNYSAPWRAVPKWSSNEGRLPPAEMSDSADNDQVVANLSLVTTASLNNTKLMFQLRISKFRVVLTHRFSPLEVFYSPRNVSFTPLKRIYSAGEYITCLADGWPRPKRQWRDETTGEGCEGDNLLLVPEMEGRRKVTCIATNIINGSLRHDVITLTIYIHNGGQSRVEPRQPWCAFFEANPPASTLSTQAATSVSNRPNDATILGLSVAGGVLLVGLIVLVVVKVRERRQRERRDNYGSGLGVRNHSTFGVLDTGVYLNALARGRATTTTNKGNEYDDYMQIDDSEEAK